MEGVADKIERAAALLRMGACAQDVVFVHSVVLKLFRLCGLSLK